ncbi:hypothetical protein Poli38472_007723 [Pythium oligandrum]|uniref:Thioredoxin domain-containing protein n=1 Tax=Pythium oligandrum TaxID=41045 RepID=A0A8K1CSX2_PYTOL|nr:hypothetical protein Poli38472_007723 [Pythium oligandrum]|eukprot:TMW68051.1 hypothetical protein Poli38472_007723 [Pythium oligandrum]
MLVNSRSFGGLFAVFAALVGSLQAPTAASFQILRSVDDVTSVVEGSSKVHAVLITSIAQLGKAEGDEAPEDADTLAKELVTKQYPHFTKVADGLDDAIEFVVADLDDTKAITTKWMIPSLPALALYADEPKVNPYTGKLYREPVMVNTAILEQPGKLRKLLRESIPTTFVTELNTEGGYKSMADVEKFVSKNKETIVVLVSKQKAPSHLYRALSVEFHDRGLAFAYLNQDDAATKDLLKSWQIESVPSLVVVKSAGDREVIGEDKMKSYADLKAFVEPFATKTAEKTTDDKASPKQRGNFPSPFLTVDNFEKQVLTSRLIWIVSFLDGGEAEKFDTKAWQKTIMDLQKKSGIVTVGVVNCETDAELCEQYGKSKVRVFPVKLGENNEVEREEVFAESFSTIEDAKQPAISAIPDTVKVVSSWAELNAFASLSVLDKSLPVVLVTKKTETPPMLKSVALSFPSQKVSFAVVSDADPQIKRQFGFDAKVSTAFVALIPVEKQKDQPEGGSPFGMALYDKKVMGPYNYPNLVHFMMSVLAQYPHPTTESSDEATHEHIVSGDASSVNVPYLTKDNQKSLCDGNKICAIGFFEGHIDTLADAESPLSKHIEVMKNVAANGKKHRQPFHFMWTNGKCQSAFAEAFGVGAFQMPTIVVYSPSKQRYATNVGLFDETNSGSFLQSVLSGKIATIPIDVVPALRDECSFEEIDDTAAVGAVVEEDDEDLSDLLSEIIGEEDKNRRKLEAELKAEQKSSKSTKKSKKKKGGKKKKKGSDRDEL